VGGDWCTTLGSEKGYIWMIYKMAAGYLLVRSESYGVRDGFQLGLAKWRR
jgi:hypothetical protein